MLLVSRFWAWAYLSGMGMGYGPSQGMEHQSSRGLKYELGREIQQGFEGRMIYTLIRESIRRCSIRMEERRFSEVGAIFPSKRVEWSLNVTGVCSLTEWDWKCKEEYIDLRLHHQVPLSLPIHTHTQKEGGESRRPGKSRRVAVMRNAGRALAGIENIIVGERGFLQSLIWMIPGRIQIASLARGGIGVYAISQCLRVRCRGREGVSVKLEPEDLRRQLHGLSSKGRRKWVFFVSF